MKSILSAVILVVSISISATAQYTETILHQFAIPGSEDTPLLRDRSGNLFGTIGTGGGEFYELPAGPPPRRVRVLFDFLNKFKSQNPAWRLKQDLAGNFYG